MINELRTVDSEPKMTLARRLNGIQRAIRPEMLPGSVASERDGNLFYCALIYISLALVRYTRQSALIAVVFDKPMGLPASKIFSHRAA